MSKSFYLVFFDIIIIILWYFIKTCHNFPLGFYFVFILPQKYLLGLQSSYISQVSDEKSDIVFYELGTWINLLLKSNPNAIESLFIPEDKIIYKDKCLNTIFENRNKFLSKTIFKHIST